MIATRARNPLLVWFFSSTTNTSTILIPSLSHLRRVSTCPMARPCFSALRFRTFGAKAGLYTHSRNSEGKMRASIRSASVSSKSKVTCTDSPTLALAGSTRRFEMIGTPGPAGVDSIRHTAQAESAMAAIPTSTLSILAPHPIGLLWFFSIIQFSLYTFKTHPIGPARLFHTDSIRSAPKA
ncbi:protein of unknown function [Candidatus Methylomirabilis oxygeniifera]|uniref:Uncharacterized protein n=1 Tax=Methylomirabilis oxygeniifera TaxID=671143 RepID=D5MN11_METO1|nr:protein of unknown function [Candidatus Methylomirabilis oxyfera]